MSAHGFKQWLQETMGLDADTIGPGVVDRAVRERMAACGSTGVAAYWQALRASTTEQQELIEAVVVPETWFFRDREAFAALARRYGPAWAAAHPGTKLRLLSLPCSTGEEPYTMAMALHDAGFPLAQLQVLALDISERALAKARRGVYGNNSFRGRDLDYRERHFQPATDGWQIAAPLRQCVNFTQGNVLDPEALPAAAAFDAVFCRNLLIYFDTDTQLRTVRALDRLLRADGLLFVGPAETGLMLAAGHVSAQLPMAFAFQKAEGAAVAAVPPMPATPSAQQASGLPSIRLPLNALSSTPLPSKPASRHAVAPAPAALRPAQEDPSVAHRDGLDQAQRLADDGDFDRAQQACQAHLQAQGPSARGLYLMGLICGARGQRARAEEFFRKALYLDPDHEETLMHLALLLETKGEAAAGRVLRVRAQRHRRTAG